MKLILGLGNPGAEYTGTRHNLGWAAVEYLAKVFTCHPEFISGSSLSSSSRAQPRDLTDFTKILRQAQDDKKGTKDDTTIWQTKPKFSAQIAETTIDGEKVILAKPQTFYNLSGNAAVKIKQFYGLSNADILVIHDDMDLPFGLIRTRQGGADAGNNGVKDLIAKIGADFARLRIGSGQTPTHDGLTKPDSAHCDYVLSRLSKAESDIFTAELATIAEIAADFLNGQFTETTYKN